MNQNFVNFLSKLDFSQEFREILLQKIIVDELSFFPKDKKVILNLKQKQLLTPDEIKLFMQNCKNNNFDIQCNWLPQISLKTQIKVVKEYCDWFTKKEYDTLIIKNISWNNSLNPTLNLTIFGDHSLFDSNKLLNFFHNYGLGIYYLKISASNNEKELSKIEDIHQNQVINYKNHKLHQKFNDYKINSLIGEILSVKEKIIQNVHKFILLLRNEKLVVFVYFKIPIDSNKEINVDFLKIRSWVKVEGYFKNQEMFFAKKITPSIQKFLRQDNADKKRIELHLHTKMSALDGVGAIEDYLAYANHWKHSAIAITDHDNLHIFPEAEKIVNKKYPNLKLLYGCEFNFLNTQKQFVIKNIDDNGDRIFIFFDIETTGLSIVFDEIIEFAAIVEKNNMIIHRVNFLIKSQKPISDYILKLTQIDLKEYQTKAIPLKEALIKIKNLFSNHILVAHNINFDINFLNYLFVKNDLEVAKNPLIDTLNWSRAIDVDLKYHRLGSVARKYKIPYKKEQAHRSFYDTKVLQKVFHALYVETELKQIQDLMLLNKKIALKEVRKKFFPFHINVLARNRSGLKTLYYLVSKASVDYLYRKPTLERDLLITNRENLLIGSGCYNGEVFQAACLENDDTLINLIDFYDYIELQPLKSYEHLIYQNFIDRKSLLLAIKRIIKAAKKLNKIIVATGDVHYLHAEDKFYRNIFIFNKQLGGSKHPLAFMDPDKIVSQHLRTTEEMLKEFEFLQDPNFVKEIVIDNTHLISDKIDRIECFDQTFLMPKFSNCNDELTKLSIKKFQEKYGNKPNEELQKRFDEELKIIITSNYSTIYLISYFLTDFTIKKKFLFGSRGSVGSSFLAYCLDITEVNPLKPHYFCKKCYYFEWNQNSKIHSGFDLNSKKCPNCQNQLCVDGHMINFEIFLGLKAENIPDIDLNFPGVFQENAQKYVYELITKKLGINKVFWTGTITKIAGKLAYGYYKNFIEKFPLLYQQNLNQAQIQEILFNCSGVKKTTGQHPGGLMIVPQNRDILDYSPYNFPSNNSDSKGLTTHFDYDVLKNQLLKIDVLGHDDPTGLIMLQKMTKIDPKTINLSDSKIIKMFYKPEILNFKDITLIKNYGLLGIPEFGTNFVSRMVNEAKPRTFAHLIALSGLSHGKNVWENNAKELIASNPDFNLDNVISCRDDIFSFLTNNGITKKFAYQIMQKVKKGMKLTNKEKNHLASHNIPKWYIDSCGKIKYLFPKAHATAYVIMACRFVWYKINFPHEFYAMCFSIRNDVFDLDTIIKGIPVISSAISELEKKQNKIGKPSIISSREKRLLNVYYFSLEMWNRGIKMASLSLKNSDANLFKVMTINNEKVLIPPFTVIDALGIETANLIVSQRDKYLKFQDNKDHLNSVFMKNNFFTMEGFQIITKLNKTALKELEKWVVFEKNKNKKQKSFNFL